MDTAFALNNLDTGPIILISNSTLLMHEMSIAVSIIDIAEHEAEKAGAKKINGIDIEIGTLSGVVMEALDFALGVAVKNSVLADTRINIIQVQGRGHCNGCGLDFSLKDLFELCPKCESADIHIMEGQELRVKSLHIES